jgi:hypothetical protein
MANRWTFYVDKTGRIAAIDKSDRRLQSVQSLQIMRPWLALVVLLAGCSGGSPSRPTPVPPQPSRITVSGAITDTVSGAQIGSFSHEVPSLPALISVSHGGYVTRTARVAASSATVDLIPEAGFDLTFYRQLVRGALDGRMDPIRRWTVNPSIYLQRTGLSDATVAALERAARDVVPALTGGRLLVATWETGQDRRSPQTGWIVAAVVTELPGNCGLSTVGGGELTLKNAPQCSMARSFAHELGHTLGFWHVSDPTMLMHAPSGADQPSSRERHHAALAYARSPGNTDVDQDQLTPGISAAPVFIE